MTDSTWLTTTKGPKPRPALRGHKKADVVIVGGGLTGVLSAYRLSQRGKSVILLEKSLYGDSATAYTTAMLTCVIDTSLNDLVHMFGEEQAKAVWRSGNEAIDEIEAIISDEKISCEFKRCDDYYFSQDESGAEELATEARVAQQLGFPVSPEVSLPFVTTAGLRIPHQAKFHPLMFMEHLKHRIEENGGRIHEKSEVTALEHGTPATVRTTHGSVEADHVIVATYDPFHHPIELFAHKGPYVSYVMEYRIPHNVLPEAIYEDTANPYHYFRVDRLDDDDRLLVGGEDHREEIPLDTEKSFAALRSFVSGLLPGVTSHEVRHWRGTILETIDGLPYIGRYSRTHENEMTAMGFSGNGMTYAMTAANIFTSLVLGERHHYEELYHPRRIPTFRQLWEKGKDYTGELFHGLTRNTKHLSKQHNIL